MIFLDATFLIAYILKRDDYNHLIEHLLFLLKYENFLINSTVINEVLNALDIGDYDKDPEKILENLLNLQRVHILKKEDYIESTKLFKYYNKSINFADCTILKTMKDHEVNTIVSFDSDFDKIKGIHRIY